MFLAVLGVAALGGVGAWFAGEASLPIPVMAYASVFVLVIAGWVVSLCLHEFGHAVTAWRFGDHDVAVRGYLTLNPLKYANPVMSLLLPILFILMGGIALPGGAVWVRINFMTKRQRSLVSLAGPSANLILAVLLLAATRVGHTPEHSVFWAGISFLALLQVMALVLNLLPIPGLDGYGALEPHLSPQTRQALEPMRQWGFLILIVLLMVPPLNGWFFDLVLRIYGLLGGIEPLAGLGYGLTLFWQH
ncbi:site-2 protease family protein [Mycolicibacterium insubricum]|mgnify:FL=1|nr:site-2 protease family protein [Mycolicibacterium insubricum]